MTQNQKIRRATLAALLAACMPHNATAGGFLLQEQSQVEIGRAFSGSAAAADDPSTVFYNPAGMTELPGIQMSAGGTALLVDSHQHDRGSTITSTTSGGFFIITNTQNITGNNGGNPFAKVVPVPTGYVSAQLGHSGVWLGLGLSAPFGLKLNYDPGFFGRYDSAYSKLLTLDAQPSIAYRLSDTVSVGGGLDVQYAKATLTNALLPSASSPFIIPTDRFVKTSADNVALGWNMGVLVKLKTGVRLGLHYRSGITHQLKGDNTLSVFSGPTLIGSQTIPIRAPLRLPDILTASISLPLSSDTRAMATGRYYNWSRFDGIALYQTKPIVIGPIFLNPSSTPIATKAFNYRDSWSLSLGLEHQRSDRLALRGGFMFDRTPTNPALLSTRVPDGDRSWLSAGLSYSLTQHLTLNASYAHVFIDSQDMDRTDISFSAGAMVAINTRSRSSGNVDMLATSVTARF